MAAIFQLRRGSGSVSLNDGELYLHKSSGSLQVSMGTTPLTLAKVDSINSGSFSIIGDITASNAHFTNNVRIDGNILLGDGAAGDTIQSLGVFTTNIVPGTTGLYDIGSNSAKWRTIWANSVTASLSGSVNGIDVTALNQRVGSLETTTASLETRAVSLATITGSLIQTASSHESRNANLATITGSLIATASSHENRFSDLATISGSLILTASSHQSRFADLAIETASLETRAIEIGIVTASLISSASSFESRNTDLATISGSLISTASNHEQRLDAMEAESGSYARTNSANSFVGNQTITGSLVTSGSKVEFNVKWPNSGSEQHIVKTDGFTLDGREYDYAAIALEHYEDTPGVYHNSILTYMFDSTNTYGSETVVGPYRAHMQVYPSGSGGNFANISVQDLKNGTTQALVYADYVQIGAYHAESIIIGNSTSVIEISGSIKNAQLNAIGTITGSLIASASSFESRNASLATISGSLILTASNHEQRIGKIEEYTSSLKTAIGLSGSNVTILGDLFVNGTTTTIDSTTIQLGDNIIELNGSAGANGGLLVKDVTNPNTVSGSLLWDSTTDYWKGGAVGNESKILLAGGDNVFTSSLQLGFINSTTASLNTSTASLNLFSASVTSSLESIYQTTASLNLFSASVTSSLISIYQTTASLNTYTTSVNNDLASIHQSSASLNLFSASVTSSLESIYQTTASLNVASASLQSFSSSTLLRLTALETETGSLESRASNLATITGSLISTASNHEQRLGQIESKSGSYDGRFADLATISGSLILSASSFESRFGTLGIETASLETRAIEIGIVTASLISSASSFESRFGTLGNETASLETRATSLATITGSLISTASSHESRFADLAIETGSLETRATTLAQVTSSLISATASLYGSASNHETRIDLLEYTASISVGAGLAAEFTKLNAWTSSTDTRIAALEAYSASYEQYFTESGSQFHIDFNV